MIPGFSAETNSFNLFKFFKNLDGFVKYYKFNQVNYGEDGSTIKMNGNYTPTNEKFFCSEFVAALYYNAGNGVRLIDEDLCKIENLRDDERFDRNDKNYPGFQDLVRVYNADGKEIKSLKPELNYIIEGDNIIFDASVSKNSTDDPVDISDVDRWDLWVEWLGEEPKDKWINDLDALDEVYDLKYTMKLPTASSQSNIVPSVQYNADSGEKDEMGIINTFITSSTNNKNNNNNNNNIKTKYRVYLRIIDNNDISTTMSYPLEVDISDVKPDVNNNSNKQGNILDSQDGQDIDITDLFDDSDDSSEINSQPTVNSEPLVEDDSTSSIVPTTKSTTILSTTDSPPTTTSTSSSTPAHTTTSTTSTSTSSTSTQTGTSSIQSTTPNSPTSTTTRSSVPITKVASANL
jgi:hypothetical protein